MNFFVLQGCHNDVYQRVLARDLPRLLPQLPVSSLHTDRRGQHEGCLQTQLTPRRIQCFDCVAGSSRCGTLPTSMVHHTARGTSCCTSYDKGFLLLRLDYTLTYWKSIFFIGYVVTAVFLVTGMLLRKKSKSVGDENKPKLN